MTSEAYDLAAALGIPCKLKKRLPAIDDTLGSLMNFMGGGMG